MPLRRLEQALRRYLQIVLALIPVGVLLGAAGGAAIARAALRPVDEMARTARRITAEALSERIARRGAGDELDYLAETLNDMLGRLEAAFGQLRRFTADAAHELRTPLTVLKGEMEVALGASVTRPSTGGCWRPASRRWTASSALAEDLLLLARTTAEAGLRRERVDARAARPRGPRRRRAPGRRAGVSVSLGAMAPAAVMGDAAALGRAVLNLVDNAVKYTPPGGRVTLSLERSGAAARIAVEDTGIGIDHADQERIFEPFVRLDEARSRETGGTGLGLAIARSIAVAHGGRLEVRSAPKAGSRFTLELPAVS